MRFWRWYWSLTKSVFGDKRDRLLEEDGFIRGNFKGMVILLKWYLVTVTLGSLAGILLYSIPEPFRSSGIQIMVYAWNLISGLAMYAWSFVEPLFGWLVGLNWSAVGESIARIYNWTFRALIFLSVALFATNLALFVTTLSVDVLRIFVFRRELNTGKRLIVVACLVISLAIGFSFASSSYGLGTVDYLVSLMEHPHAH